MPHKRRFFLSLSTTAPLMLSHPLPSHHQSRSGDANKHNAEEIDQPGAGTAGGGKHDTGNVPHRNGVGSYAGLIVRGSAYQSCIVSRISCYPRCFDGRITLCRNNLQLTFCPLI